MTNENNTLSQQFLGSIGYSVNAKLKCYLKIGNGNIGAGFSNNCKKVSSILCKSPSVKIAKCAFAKNFKCEKEVKILLLVLYGIVDL